MKKKNEQSFDQFEIQLIEIGNYLYSHVLLVAIASFAAASIVGLWTFFFKIPYYETNAYISVKTMTKDPLDPDGNSTYYWASQTEIENKIYVLTVFLRSNKFRSTFLDEVQGVTNYLAEYENSDREKRIVQRYLRRFSQEGREARISALNTLIGIEGDSNTRKVIIKSISSDPILARAVSNLGAELVVHMNYENLLKEMTSVVTFVEKQTKATYHHLRSLEDRLAQIQSKERILSIPDVSSTTDRDHMQRLNVIHALEVEVAANEIWVKQLESMIGEFKRNLESGGDSHLYLGQMRRRLDLLQYQQKLSSKERLPASGVLPVDQSMRSTLEEFTATFDELQKSGLSSDPWKYLANLEASMIKAKQSQVEARSKLKAQKQQVEKSEGAFSRLPTVLKEITHLKRDIGISEDLYSRLQAKLQETKILMAGRSNDLSMLLYAKTPNRPMGLSIWKKFIISFVGGGLLLIVILSLRYILIPTVRSREDLRRAGTTLIAEVPFARFYRSKNVEGFDENHPLLLTVSPNSDEANAVRQARFNIEEKLGLHNARFEGDAKVLTVCSANSAEGKSFVSANLAHSLSMAQFRVLIIDLDLLKPCLREYFDVKRIQMDIPGVQPEGDIQFEKIELNEFLDLVDAPEARDAVTDLLETPMLGDYLNMMKSQYDVVIIDTPPIRNSMEALIASRYSDGLIYVANQRHSLRHDVLRAIDTLKETYDKPIFSILNFSYDELNASRRRVAARNRVLVRT